MLSGQQVVTRLVVFLVAAVALAGVALCFNGPTASFAVVLGVVSTWLSLLGTWLTVQWVGKVLKDDSPTWHGSVVPIAGLVIKLPVILGAMSWALRLGPPAPAWFLAGLALVYSGLVWWAVARQRTQVTDFHE